MQDVCSLSEISLEHWSSQAGMASLPCALASAHWALAQFSHQAQGRQLFMNLGLIF